MEYASTSPGRVGGHTTGCVDKPCRCERIIFATRSLFRYHCSYSRLPTAGQPTLYKPDYCTQAHNYCLLGATNEDLAGFFDVTRRTIDNWIASHADFAAAVRSGRVVADMRVARCLYERAVGWQQTVERTVLHQGAEKVLKNIVNHPPDVRACIFWLRNRRRGSWGDRVPVSDDDSYDMIAELDAAGERARREPIPSSTDAA